MQGYTVTRHEGDITLNPKEAPLRSLVWMHGLGDTAEGWVDAFTQYDAVPPATRVVLLTAPVAPVTISYGMRLTSWFDILGTAYDRSSVSFSEAASNTHKVIEAVDREVAFHKGEAGRVFVGGFSQGAAMALHAGLDAAKAQLGGIVALSGFLFEETALRHPATPVLVAHGTDDAVIPLAHALKSYARIRSLPQLQLSEIAGLGHTISPQVIKLVRAFFAR